MSKQLLVNNANAVPAAAAGVESPADVAEGRIAAFNADDFSAGTLDLTSTTDAERIVFVQGGKEDAIISPVFNVKDIQPSQLNEQEYVAPVNQVTTVTAATGSGFATVRVVQAGGTTDPYQGGFKPHQRITVEVKLDGKTATAIAEELAKLINKARPGFVSASNSGADLVITGKLGVSFETQTDDEASGWAIAATTAMNEGTGTSLHIRNIEELAYGGNFTNRIYLPVQPESYVVDGETYDLFVVRVPTNTTANISSANKFLDVYLAVQATATGIDLPVFFGHEEESV